MQKHKKKYNYFYKITNTLNNKFYYGIHSTDNIDDGYMGSGTQLKRAINKYGIENFKKEILKFFDTREELSEYEKIFVNENLIHDQNCYNVSCGGDSYNTIGTVSIIDQNGNKFRCDVNDPLWKNGTYKTATNGMVTVFDLIENKYVSIKKNEYLKYKDRYKFPNADSVIVKLKDASTNEYFIVSTEEYHKNKDMYQTATSNKVIVIDKCGNSMSVDKDDPKYINGEYKFFWSGKKKSEESKQKQRNTFKQIKHQQGEKNSHFGTHWMTKDNKSVVVKEDDIQEYLNNGYTFGRYVKDKKDTYLYAYTNLICPVCGKEFKFRKISIRKGRINFCSKECRTKYKIDNNIIKQPAKKDKNYKSHIKDDNKEHLSNEIRNKIRKSMTPENSKNPRIWVSKSGITKYIKKELLNNYLSDGWELGRKNYKPIPGNQGREIIII